MFLFEKTLKREGTVQLTKDIRYIRTSCKLRTLDELLDRNMSNATVKQNKHIWINKADRSGPLPHYTRKLLSKYKSEYLNSGPRTELKPHASPT